MTAQNQIDLVQEAAAILEFVIEALGALALRGHNGGLSEAGADGLAFICIYLRGLCQKAAQAD